jgi:serine/threonine protein kinase
LRETDIPPEEMTLTGSLYAGKFDVIDRLGEGAMGAVYRARHLATNEWVALKRLHPEHVDDAEVVARFNREMEATASVRHPNTARVIDYGREGSDLFLAMEIVTGRSLDEVIVDDAPMPPERVVHITGQIASALGAAHEAQFVHRDLKPENIMLTSKGGDPDFVKVLDFGLAAIVDSSGSAQLTAQGLRVGTPLFMAPEYIEGKPTDHRADLYALGVVMYMMAAGTAPHKGSPYSILHKAVTETPVPPSEIAASCPAWLESVILRLLEKNPEQRVQSAEELVALLVERKDIRTRTPTVRVEAPRPPPEPFARVLESGPVTPAPPAPTRPARATPAPTAAPPTRTPTEPAPTSERADPAPPPRFFLVMLLGMVVVGVVGLALGVWLGR